MARVALIKLFTGLNLAVHQLSGELQRGGHDSLVVYLKDFIVVPAEEMARYEVTEYAGMLVGARAKEYCWNCYTPYSEREYELLFDELERFGANLIGLSLTSLTMKPAAEVTAQLKRRFPTVPVIWGGSGPTIEPEWACEHADLVCTGEGEELIVELADRIDAGADYADLPSLWLKREGEIVRNPTGPLLDLEEIAIPDFTRIRTVHIDRDVIWRNIYPMNLGAQYPIMTQRGCPFSCNFCIESVYQDMFGKKGSLRRRSVDVVIEELARAKQAFGIKSVMFYDDVFTVNPGWLRDFAPRYQSEIGLPFWCYTYPTTTRKDDLLLLKAAGLKSITMGIQSGSTEMLDVFNRPVAHAKAHEAARTILECGIDGYFDLITKTHFEKEQHLRETFEFLLEFPPDMQSAGFGAMTALPTYGYTDRMVREGAEISVDQSDYRYYHKLYLLTRTKLPRWLVKTIGNSKIVRRYPQLMDPLLPEKLPTMFLLDEGDAALAEHILNLPHAQAVFEREPGPAAPLQ